MDEKICTDFEEVKKKRSGIFSYRNIFYYYFTSNLIFFLLCFIQLWLYTQDTQLDTRLHKTDLRENKNEESQIFLLSQFSPFIQFFSVFIFPGYYLFSNMILLSIFPNLPFLHLSYFIAFFFLLFASNLFFTHIHMSVVWSCCEVINNRIIFFLLLS